MRAATLALLLAACDSQAGALSLTLDVDTEARHQAQAVCIAYYDLRARGAGPDTTAESWEIHHRAVDACDELDYGPEVTMRTEQ